MRWPPTGAVKVCRSVRGARRNRRANSGRGRLCGRPLAARWRPARGVGGGVLRRQGRRRRHGAPDGPAGELVGRHRGQVGTAPSSTFSASRKLATCWASLGSAPAGPRRGAGVSELGLGRRWLDHSERVWVFRVDGGATALTAWGNPLVGGRFFERAKRALKKNRPIADQASSSHSKFFSPVPRRKKN